MRNHKALASWLFAALAAVICIGGATATAQSNRVQVENAKAGATDWLLTRVARHDDEIYELGWHRRKGIEAYASHTSIKAGETLNVHVSTYPVNRYSARIYRMGYYGGAGARLMQSLGPLQGTAEPTPQDGERNLVACTWKVGLQPGDSGRLVERCLSREAVHASGARRSVPGFGDDQRELLHLHRPRRSPGRPPLSGLRHDLAVVQPLAPVAIDVRPGRRSVGRIERQGRVRRRVRPAVCAFWNGFPAGFHPQTNGSGEFLMTEFPLAFWLEKEGYDVTYISNVDTHADGKGLLRGKAFLSVGHDEVLDPADVRQRHQRARCRREPRVPVGQLDFRRRRTAARRRWPSQPGHAPRRAELPG